jgi:hypothetical protein
VPDLSSIANATTAIQSLNNLVLVSPQATIGYQPQPNGNAAAQPALLFHYEGENSVDCKSDITDHFVEDNTSIADQIALRPESIRVQGFIGDLNDIPPNQAFRTLKLLADKLVTVGAYTPGLSATAVLAYNQAAFLYSVGLNAANTAVSSAQSIGNAVSGGGAGGLAVVGSNGLSNDGLFIQSKQQIAFQQFYGYWRKRTLFTVQTPWAVFQSCAIDSLRVLQTSESNSVTEFEVTFKTMRFASTQNFSSNANNTQGQLKSQSAAPVSSQSSLSTSSVAFPYV